MILNFNFHDIKVNCQSNHQSFLDEVALEFAPFAAQGKVESDDIRIVFSDLDLNPDLACQIDALQNSGHNIQEARLRDCLIQIIDYNDFSINIFVKGDWNPDQALLILVGSLGGMLKLKLQQKFRIAGFHGAALSWNDRGILLPGDTGAGKTTLSYCCLCAGFGYLSDEDSIITQTDTPTQAILAYPRRHRIGLQLSEVYPQIFSNPYPHRHYQIYDEPGLIFNMYQACPEAYIPSVPLNACLLLNNEKDYSGAPK